MPSSTECADHVIRTVPLIVRELWNRLQAETPHLVTFSQLGLLSHLCQERLTLTDLAQKWGVSAPTMSKMISLLVDRGWVVREVDPSDRRRKLLSLSESGCEVHKHTYEAVQQSLARTLDVLKDGQHAQVVSALDLLFSVLSEESIVGKPDRSA
jgi:DNA-binding MarR family transcriptional regulator